MAHRWRRWQSVRVCHLRRLGAIFERDPLLSDIRCRHHGLPGQGEFDRAMPVERERLTDDRLELPVAPNLSIASKAPDRRRIAPGVPRCDSSPCGIGELSCIRFLRFGANWAGGIRNGHDSLR
jgi:hypothetical protein